MKETVYNLYLFIDTQHRVLYLGHILYEVDGTDDEKEAFMREVAEQDYKKAKLTKAPLGLTLDAYNARARLGGGTRAIRIRISGASTGSTTGSYHHHSGWQTSDQLQNRLLPDEHGGCEQVPWSYGCYG